MHPTDLQELAHARQDAILEEAERRRALRRAPPMLTHSIEQSGRLAVSRLSTLLLASRRALALVLRRSPGPARQRGHGAPPGPRQQPA
jgi:hypothetical protein